MKGTGTGGAGRMEEEEPRTRRGEAKGYIGLDPRQRDGSRCAAEEGSEAGEGKKMGFGWSKSSRAGSLGE